MDKNDMKRVGRNAWGWFTICVWIFGVPQFIQAATTGVRAVATEVHCSLTNCGKAPVDEKQEEVLGEMSVEEWKEIQTLRKANKRR